MNNPKLLILDEPTVGVDRVNVEAFYKTLNQLNDDGITIILISHNINEASANFTHVLSIHNGEGVFKLIEREVKDDD
jgi:zinc transport system ATP-binding protein